MKKKISVSKISLLIILMFDGGVTVAQNLLVNNGFDTDLNGWFGAQTTVWDPFDVMNSSASGSALIKNDESIANSEVEVLWQCLSNDVGAYNWGTWVYIPQNQNVSGYVAIRYKIRLNSTDCSGGFQAAGFHLYDQPGQWGLLLGNDINYNLGGSIEYSLAIQKTEADGEFVAYVDDAYLFTDIIFVDSFE